MTNLILQKTNRSGRGRGPRVRHIRKLEAQEKAKRVTKIALKKGKEGLVQTGIPLLSVAAKFLWEHKKAVSILFGSIVLFSLAQWRISLGFATGEMFLITLGVIFALAGVISLFLEKKERNLRGAKIMSWLFMGIGVISMIGGIIP